MYRTFPALERQSLWCSVYTPVLVLVFGIPAEARMLLGLVEVAVTYDADDNDNEYLLDMFIFMFSSDKRNPKTDSTTKKDRSEAHVASG